METTIHTCRVCGKQFPEKRYGKNMYCSHPCRGEGRRVAPVVAFWAKVSKADGDSCWGWTGALISTGYGLISVRGELTLAHRYSYTVNVSPIPDGLHVLHRCDNPKCVRPDHLFLGTNNDNIADRVAKGRGRGPRPGLAGEKNRNAKLTADAVRRMRILAASGVSHLAISKQFSVSRTTANRIINRKSWASVV